MKEKMFVKIIVVIGIGFVVFVILGWFVVILIGIFNMNLEMLYLFFVLMLVVFGLVVGGLIGLIGYMLKDFIMYGSVWWSWIICLGIIGIIFGFVGCKMDF